jgi:hypothetical protein
MNASFVFSNSLNQSFLLIWQEGFEEAEEAGRTMHSGEFGSKGLPYDNRFSNFGKPSRRQNKIEFFIILSEQ